jgi:hypothetical protein
LCLRWDVVLCIAIEAFHTLQKKLKEESKTFCLVDVRKENHKSGVISGWKDSILFHIKFGGIRSCEINLTEWLNACSSNSRRTYCNYRRPPMKFEFPPKLGKDKERSPCNF